MVNYLKHFGYSIVLALMITLSGCQSVENAFVANRATSSTLAVSSGTRNALVITSDKQKKADVQLAMARSYERQDNFDQARKLYAEAIRNDDRRADGFHRLAILHDKIGDRKKAHAYYRAALKRDPENPVIHCDLGYSYYLQSRLSESEASLRRALALKPTFRLAHNNLGLLLARTDRSREGLREFSLAGLSEAEARTNLTHSLMLEKRWDEASREWQLADREKVTSEAVRQKLARMKTALAHVETNSPPVAVQVIHVEPGGTLRTETVPQSTRNLSVRKNHLETTTMEAEAHSEPTKPVLKMYLK